MCNILGRDDWMMDDCQIIPTIKGFMPINIISTWDWMSREKREWISRDVKVRNEREWDVDEREREVVDMVRIAAATGWTKREEERGREYAPTFRGIGDGGVSVLFVLLPADLGLHSLTHLTRHSLTRFCHVMLSWTASTVCYLNRDRSSSLSLLSYSRGTCGVDTFRLLLSLSHALKQKERRKKGRTLYNPQVTF